MATILRISEKNGGYGTRDSAQLALLAATANDVLTHADPQQFLPLLFDRLDAYCGLEVCFSYWVTQNRLHLAFATGVSEETQKQIEWLSFGEAVCGTVAQNLSPITAQDIQMSPEAITSWVRSMGVQAYCCHPLIANGKLLGTLSFGTRTRPMFGDSEVSLMKAVSDQVAVALDRFLLLRELRAKNELLERANQDLGHFTYAMSHDLQEPVRTVAIYSNILSRALANNISLDNQQKLQIIVSAAEHLGNLVNGVLDYMQASNEEPNENVINLNEAIT